MSNAKTQLRTAIFKALTAHGDLLSILGGPRIYDAVPEQSALPYVVLGRTTSADWSTATETGETHTIFLHIWSDASDRDGVDAVETVIRDALAASTLPLADHHLIQLRFQLSETARNSARDQYHTVLRFRAVTEPR
ncbi:MAG: DUF3168 domain-containing protein [Pseudomonadota bacterium]